MKVEGIMVNGKMRNAYVRVMRKQGDKCDKKFAACVQTDCVCSLIFESFCAIVESLDKLKHSSGFESDETIDE